MSKRAQRPDSALARWLIALIASAIGVAALVWLSAPSVVSYVAGSAARSAETACGYSEAQDTANKAASAVEREQVARQRTPSAARTVEAQAAERRRQRAQECEERARDRADLDAQWRSAYAAENTLAMTTRLRWFALLETILLIATVVAAFMAIWDSRRHNAMQSRAFVYPEGYEDLSVVKGKAIDRHEVGAKIKNVGVTPAKRLFFSSSGQFADGDLPDNFEYPDGAVKRADPTYLGPQQEFTIAMANCPIEQMVKWWEGPKNRHFYIWGWIDYDDSFGARRRTEFCVRASLLGDPRLNPQCMTFSNYGPHNATDDDCMKQPKSAEEEQARRKALLAAKQQS